MSPFASCAALLFRPEKLKGPGRWRIRTLRSDPRVSNSRRVAGSGALTTRLVLPIAPLAPSNVSSSARAMVTVRSPAVSVTASAFARVILPLPQLTKVLTHHVVEGKIAPEDLAGKHKTLAGDEITVEGSGEDFTIGEANVICGNVQTANATVYLIDSVMMPKM